MHKKYLAKFGNTKKIWKPKKIILTSLSGKKKKSWDIIFGADVVHYKQQLDNENKIKNFRRNTHLN
jgi:hypothetical protein